MKLSYYYQASKFIEIIWLQKIMFWDILLKQIKGHFKLKNNNIKTSHNYQKKLFNLPHKKDHIALF